MIYEGRKIKVKKIFLSLVMLFSLIVFSSCGIENNSNEIYIAERMDEFFNIKVDYVEESKSYSDDLDRNFVIEISRKKSEYTFSACSPMEITIYYTSYRKDTGEYDGRNFKKVKVDYDENGYGYDEVPISYNLVNITYLYYEAKISNWEVAIRS